MNAAAERAGLALAKGIAEWAEWMADHEPERLRRRGMRNLISLALDFEDALALSDPGEDTVGAVRRGAHDTEVGAAYDVMPNTGTQRLAVLEAIAAAGAHGRTDYENDQTIEGLSRSSASTRRIELVKGGWVEDSGQRRQTGTGSDAIVWVLTEKARDELGVPSPE